MDNLRFRIICLAAVLLIGPAGSAAGEQGREGQLGRWLGQLAAEEVSLRESARIELMAMDRADLELFLEVVRSGRPLLPSQAVVLREIIWHVYLSEEPYESVTSPGFIGVNLMPMRFAVPVEGAEEARSGYALRVNERYPGFIGYRMLREGDVVLRLMEQPHVELRNAQNLSDALGNAGEMVHLEVLRQGRVVQVPIVLDPRPARVDNQDRAWMDELLRRRAEQAEAYWRQRFAPLVEETVS